MSIKLKQYVQLGTPIEEEKTMEYQYQTYLIETMMLILLLNLFKDKSFYYITKKPDMY